MLVGDDPASHIYVTRKHEAAQQAGIRSLDRRLPAETSEEELLELLEELNADDSVDGILVQLPLPPQIDEARVIRAVDPEKDVDGFHPLNAGQLYLGRPTLVPATPLGIMALLAEHRIPLDGARAVVVGRSDIVGKPVAHLLLQANATVTVCHSHTADLARETLDADVLVVAVGIPALVSPDMVKTGSVVVDVGMNRTRGGPRRRRRPGRRRPRRVHHAGARRRRADDDRDAAPQHGSGRPLPPQNACVPLRPALTFAPLRQSPAARCPGRRLCVRRNVGSGHRQVVLEREGVRVHRA